MAFRKTDTAVSDGLITTIGICRGNIGFLIARAAGLRSVRLCDVRIDRSSEALHVDCQLSVDGNANVLTSNFLTVSERTAEALGYSQSVIGPNVLRYTALIDNHWTPHGAYTAD